MASTGLLLPETGNPRTTDLGDRYRAPALDKGLDIIELLSAADVPLSQTEIANAVGRSPNEIFRVLERLVKRGYVLRVPSEGYELSLKLFALGNRHAMLRRLAALAGPAMARLARQTKCTCYLAVHERGRVIVLAQTDPPGRAGPVLHVGLHLPLLGEAAGHVLLGFQPPVQRKAMLAEARVVPPPGLPPRLAAVRARATNYCRAKAAAWCALPRRCCAATELPWRR